MQYNCTKIIRRKKEELSWVLSTGKYILKSKEFKKANKEVSKNIIDEFLTRRKMNPALIGILDGIEEEDKLLGEQLKKEYIDAIHGKGRTSFFVTHNREGSRLNLIDRNIMKRAAKYEEKALDNFKVYQNDSKVKKLMSATLRKIKGPKLSENEKHYKGKAITKIAKKTLQFGKNKFTTLKDRIKVNNENNVIEESAIKKLESIDKISNEKNVDKEMTK